MSFNSKYTGAQVEELLGKIPTANDIWHTGNFNPSDYLPKSGGNINSNSPAPLIINSSTASNAIEFRLALKSANKAALGWDSSNGLYMYETTSKKFIGVKTDGTPYYYNGSPNTLIHSGNIGSQSVDSATKLQTARTIWGQSFDGTADISTSSSAKMPYVIFKNYNDDGDAGYVGRGSNSSNGIQLCGYSGNAINIAANNKSGHIYINTSGNVGIGTTSPAYKLDVSGDIHASGSVTQDSDINLKNISKDILIPLDDIAEAPLFEFTYKNDENKRIHVGTSAQYWVEKNNWFCKKQDNGYYDMEIQNLALASAISIAREFKKYKEETESTIDSIKKEIKELKQIILNMNK